MRIDAARLDGAIRAARHLRCDRIHLEVAPATLIEWRGELEGASLRFSALGLITVSIGENQIVPLWHVRIRNLERPAKPAVLIDLRARLEPVVMTARAKTP